MNATRFRRLRIAVGTLVLGTAALAFADAGGWIPPQLAHAILWPQFTPSLLALLSGSGWMAAGCIAVLILTLGFGRIYCAMLCPLGVLMDATAKLARRTGKNRKLPYMAGFTWIRVLIVTICVAGIAAGTALPLAFLDPYSIFGKISASTLHPIIIWGNHHLAGFGSIHPIKAAPLTWISIGIALGLLGLIAITAVRRGRLWCNTVCPVGAILGLFSKRSIFKLRISNASCIGCSLCERVCPSQCIDFRNHRIDHSRCVMCLDCVTACKRSGISFDHGNHTPNQSQPLQAREKQQMASSKPAPVDARRRIFLASTVAIPVAALADTSRPAITGNPLTQDNKPAVLPPGSKSLAHFQSRCTACQLCIVHCPDHVLRPSVTQHGLAGFLQPYQDFSASFCSYNCSDCSQICPTGAIQPISIEERRLVRTGRVGFFRDRCVVETHGTSCGACSEHCPTQAVHMVPFKNNLTIPEITPDLCIGCGGCEFICPVRPYKAIIVSGLPTHESATPINLGRENTVREMEEEFPF